MGFSFTKREIRLQSGILHYKMGFLLYKRDSRVAIHPFEADQGTDLKNVLLLSVH